MKTTSIEELFREAISIRNQGDLQKAISSFEEIIKTYPNHPKISGVFTLLAGVYNDKGATHNAMLNFKKATELNPKSELASLGLYLSYVKLEEYDKAIEELGRYLDKYPAERYKITLEELLTDLEQGYAINYKGIIKELAQKNGFKVK
ncbi:tetratricopeptide repeat protein [Flammeovirgaceae bacterium SG7u.111]|nr:tetratricopeptide repeat protein [Flammeovirgaceae bacterium SG7u.132]WPO36741.1 tetratricopeptide repeat protein [Flammeovirgaceae bacterium SG7u.111]